MFVNGTSRGWKVGMKHSDEETKEKMSKSTKGLVLWNKGGNLAPEVKVKRKRNMDEKGL